MRAMAVLSCLLTVQDHRIKHFVYQRSAKRKVLLDNIQFKGSTSPRTFEDPASHFSVRNEERNAGKCYYQRSALLQYLGPQAPVVGESSFEV